MNATERIDVDLVVALDALLTERNVTRAAARLGLSQPALSARLTRLREVTGDRLFVAAPSGRWRWHRWRRGCWTRWRRCSSRTASIPPPAPGPSPSHCTRIRR